MMIPEGASVYAEIVRRIRASDTLFGDNVKLSMRQLDEDQLSRLALPWALVVPTLDRPPNRAVDNDYDVIMAPRAVAIICQFDGRNSDHEHLAAADIERGRYQLLDTLVNWRPFPHYGATGYGGMRVEAVKSPAVRVSFVFTFHEQLNFTCEEEDDCEAQTGAAARFIVAPVPECGEPSC